MGYDKKIYFNYLSYFWRRHNNYLPLLADLICVISFPDAKYTTLNKTKKTVNLNISKVLMDVALL